MMLRMPTSGRFPLTAPSDLISDACCGTSFRVDCLHELLGHLRSPPDFWHVRIDWMTSVPAKLWDEENLKDQISLKMCHDHFCYETYFYEQNRSACGAAGSITDLSTAYESGPCFQSPFYECSDISDVSAVFEALLGEMFAKSNVDIKFGGSFSGVSRWNGNSTLSEFRGL
jgi:hypothetical protein